MSRHLQHAGTSRNGAADLIATKDRADTANQTECGEPVRPANQRRTTQRALVGLCSLAIALFALISGAAPASAGTPARVLNDHHLVAAVDYDLHEFSPDTEDFVVKASASDSTDYLKKGSPNGRTLYLTSPKTPSGGYGFTKVQIKEKDASGAITATTTSMLVLHGAIAAQTTITVDVPANYKWTFYIWTADDHFSYSHDTVNITNLVS